MSDDETTTTAVHEHVAREYAARLEEQRCRPATTGAGRLYDDDELAALPPGLAEESLGCGNPLNWTEVRPGETVVDLGCGAGLDLVLAARRTGPAGKVIGIDMTEVMVQRARAHVAKAGLTNVEVRHGLIERLPVEDASVDWVISNCVVSLSPDKPAVFREIARVLRPGGRMLISDIVVEDPPAWVRWVVGRWDPGTAQARSEADYLEGLRAAGLEDVTVRARAMFDRESLFGLLSAEVVEGGAGLLKRALLGAVARKAARDLEGKVASIRVHARRAVGP